MVKKQRKPKMKTDFKQTSRQIYIQVNVLRSLAWRQVSDQVWYQVHRQVWGLVWGQVWDQVSSQVRDDLNEN